MPTRHVSPRLLAIVCGLGLSLGGCMAAIPLAQMAISRPSSSDQPCAGCATNTLAGPMGDISRSVSDSLRKWTGGSPEDVSAKYPAPITR
jgi:hypothetical protein